MLLAGLLLFSATTVSAHFNFALPNEWSMNQANANEIQLIWGHPYEGIYFDAPVVENAKVLKPNGTESDLTPTEITVTGAEGSAKAWEVTFTPDIKGDYIIYADFEALVVEEEEVAWEDHVKAIIHYKTSEGWDQTTGQIMEIVPLTKPYGLEEGFIFTGKVLYNGIPLADAPIEIEMFYPVGVCTEENLPEEPMVTRETKSDPNGIFSFTLDEPGVWVVCASNTVGSMEGYDLDIRGILMIPVEEELSLTPSDEGTDGVTQNDLDDLETSLEEKDNSLEDDIKSLDEKLGTLQNLAIGSLVLSIIAILIALVSVFRAKKK
jgi:cobalt/nickel transport protein